VQAEHQMVVFAAARLGDVQLFHQPGRARQRPADLRQELGREFLEGLADTPDARLAVRIQVVEHAQQAHAAGRIRRKRIDMQAGVVLAPTGLPAFDAEQAQRGVAAFEMAAVMREQTIDQGGRLVAVASDHGAQLGQFFGRAGGAAQGFLVRVTLAAQADVLGLAVGPAGVEKAGFGIAQGETQRRKMQHAAAFDQFFGVMGRGLVARLVARVGQGMEGGDGHGGLLRKQAPRLPECREWAVAPPEARCDRADFAQRQSEATSAAYNLLASDFPRNVLQ